MSGDPGPYVNDDGDIWVPRTVPYLKARHVARETEIYPGQRLVYVGKDNAYLMGFARDCECEGRCSGGPATAFDDRDPAPECRVLAWHFQIVEP